LPLNASSQQKPSMSWSYAGNSQPVFTLT